LSYFTGDTSESDSRDCLADQPLIGKGCLNQCVQTKSITVSLLVVGLFTSLMTITITALASTLTHDNARDNQLKRKYHSKTYSNYILLLSL